LGSQGTKRGPGLPDCQEAPIGVKTQEA
jgi:hypothetical protein